MSVKTNYPRLFWLNRKTQQTCVSQTQERPFYPVTLRVCVGRSSRRLYFPRTFTSTLSSFDRSFNRDFSVFLGINIESRGPNKLPFSHKYTSQILKEDEGTESFLRKKKKPCLNHDHRHQYLQIHPSSLGRPSPYRKPGTEDPRHTGRVDVRVPPFFISSEKINGRNDTLNPLKEGRDTKPKGHNLPLSPTYRTTRRRGGGGEGPLGRFTTYHLTLAR